MKKTVNLLGKKKWGKKEKKEKRKDVRPQIFLLPDMGFFDIVFCYPATNIKARAVRFVTL